MDLTFSIIDLGVFFRGGGKLSKKIIMKEVITAFNKNQIKIKHIYILYPL